MAIRCAYVQLKSYLSQRLDHQDSFLARIVEEQSRALAALPSPSTKADSDDSDDSEKSVPFGCTAPTSDITLAKHPLQDDPCAECKCACHSQWTVSTPNAYSPVAGLASLRSIGRFFHSQSCDDSQCRRPSHAFISATFCMPHWLATRALLLTLVKGPVFTISLAFARIIPADSELFRCIQSGDCTRMHQLFKQREASPSDMIRTRYGTLNALLFALNCNRVDVCRLLISWGADPFAENDTSLTGSPVDMAWCMSKEYKPTVPYADDVEAVFPLPRDLGRLRFSRLHRLVVGLDHGSLDEALEMSKAVLDARDRDGRSATHWAAWVGDTIVLRKILDAGADPDLPDGGGRTPIHFSAMTCSALCARLLVESGADASKPDNQNESPLHTACSTGRTTNIKYLLSIGVPVNAVNIAKTTPLMSAVLAQGLEAVEILLDHGVDLEAKDELGETAFTLAIWTNAHEIARRLLAAGARPDVITNSGRTVLHTVAQSGTLGLIEVLLGARTLLLVNPDERDATGLTALEKFRKRTDVPADLTAAFLALWLRCSCLSDTNINIVPEPGDSIEKVPSVVVEVFEQSESEDESEDFEAAVEYF